MEDQPFPIPTEENIEGWAKLKGVLLRAKAQYKEQGLSNLRSGAWVDVASMQYHLTKPSKRVHTT